MLSFLLTLVDNPENKLTVERLFNQYEHKMLAVAMNVLKNQQLAEDAVQDTFVAIIRNLHRLDAENNIEGYILKSVRHRALDIARKTKHETLTYDTVGVYFSQDDSNAALHFENVELIDIAARIIASLPEKLSDVFIMYYNEDMSCAQIADRLGISYDAAFKRLQRAKSILGKRMQEEGYIND